jgi:SAM-dependent methyltransferase
MVSFVCNICGRLNEIEHFASEPASCECGSNVRIRALIHLLSLELFGESRPLVDFPVLKSIRGLGMSDQEGYARLLAEKFAYINTYYDRAPRMDFLESHTELYGAYDFILSTEVLEHIAPPVDRALDEVCRLLKPRGFFALTVFCNPGDHLREHYPDLNTYRIVALGDQMVLINRRIDGSLEIHSELVFHDGAGATLEMREFGITALKQKLRSSGFSEVKLLTEDVPNWGILFDQDVSQPLIARKERFTLSEAALDESGVHNSDLAGLHAEIRSLRSQMQMAQKSRWLKLGRKFGLGPTFH